MELNPERRDVEGIGQGQGVRLASLNRDQVAIKQPWSSFNCTVNVGLVAELCQEDIVAMEPGHVRGRVTVPVSREFLSQELVWDWTLGEDFAGDVESGVLILEEEG